MDLGQNTPLPNGMTRETGEMVNPATGVVEAYEEIWREEECHDGVFVRNVASSVWRARVGTMQLALGRTPGPKCEFWAWQAEKSGEGWVVGYATPGLDAEVADYFLPEDCSGWQAGSTVEWRGETWVVLEN